MKQCQCHCNVLRFQSRSVRSSIYALFHACLLLFIGHGFFFGITFLHKNKCVLGGVFLRKKRWPIPPGWAGGAPPSRTLPGGLRHLTLAAALFIPFLRHCVIKRCGNRETNNFLFLVPSPKIIRRRRHRRRLLRKV